MRLKVVAAKELIATDAAKNNIIFFTIFNNDMEIDKNMRHSSFCKVSKNKKKEMK